MKKSFKGFIMGLIMGLVISCVCVGAVTEVVTKELHYNDIKVTLNGKEITPKDANGKVVEPFIIDGTTYLPVRAVASALGLEVNWDGETNTVKLGKDSSDAGKVIYDKDGMKLVYKGVTNESSNRVYYIIEIENNTEEELTVRGVNVYCDGYATDGFAEFIINVEPGKKAIRMLDVNKEQLKLVGVNEIETVEFTLRCIDPRSTQIRIEEKVTFNP